jgi:hypothetical protein
MSVGTIIALAVAATLAVVLPFVVIVYSARCARKQLDDDALICYGVENPSGTTSLWAKTREDISLILRINFYKHPGDQAADQVCRFSERIDDDNIAIALTAVWLVSVLLAWFSGLMLAGNKAAFLISTFAFCILLSLPSSWHIFSELCGRKGKEGHRQNEGQGLQVVLVAENIFQDLSTPFARVALMGLTQVILIAMYAYSVSQIILDDLSLP